MLRHAWVVVAIVCMLSGCKRFIGLEEPGSSGETDGGAGDAIIGDGPVGSVCGQWSPTAIPTGLSGGDWVLPPGNYAFDTSNGSLFDNDQPQGQIGQAMSVAGQDLWVLSFDRVEFPVELEMRFIGSRPVVIAATGDIVVAGVLDLNSTDGPQGGAAGERSMCPDGPGIGIGSASGSGGGGGGGFGDAGGRGGAGNAASPGDGGSGEDPPPVVRGGCEGADGGGNDGGRGGEGGGGIHLISQGTLQVSGSILAGGAGGDGAASGGGLGGPGGPDGGSGGGGGGGSGGMIALQASRVEILASAVLAANGGGGGSGADDDDRGDSGDDSTGPVAASGGNGSNNAGSGGRGSTRDVPVGLPGEAGGPSQNGGGGGGGGGAGYIVIDAPDQDIADVQSLSPMCPPP